MSHGTQLDLFEPLHAIDEIKSAIKNCAEQIADMYAFSNQQQITLSNLYLSLKLEAEGHNKRVAKMEKSVIPTS